ncbi:hypothetical protein GALMADRAFT_919075 [Galerina marginata CBS 339.88]|uniref:Uncharacterized protein n=1 Tax=Galerina marginata (strain CBS 339.88) TaxID=685588 RepID=A0A067SRE8_GALM3|nr:hypothetical protein GALMADRAFT_919075 [Galerina marginata CBS 339.88]
MERSDEINITNNGDGKVESQVGRSRTAHSGAKLRATTSTLKKPHVGGRGGGGNGRNGVGRQTSPDSKSVARRPKSSPRRPGVRSAVVGRIHRRLRAYSEVIQTRPRVLVLSRRRTRAIYLHRGSPRLRP